MNMGANLLKRFRQSVSRLRRDKSGVSAIEFALIAPIMMTIYFACIELSFMMVLDRKVTSATSTLGDLAARDDEISDADVTDLFEATRMLFQPNDIAAARMRLTSISDDGTGVMKVDWSESRNMTAYSVDQVMTVPTNVITTNGSVIFAEIEYDYESTFEYFFSGKKTLSDEFYLRPRQVTTITRCGTC